MSEITFVGRLAPGEEKWWGTTWDDELKGEPPAIPASTVQSATWSVLESEDIQILDQRHSDYVTAVKVKSGTVGKHILKVVAASDQGEIHTRRVAIEVEIH